MEKLISRKEAAKLLGISIATLDAARNLSLIHIFIYERGYSTLHRTYLLVLCSMAAPKQSLPNYTLLRKHQPCFISRWCLSRKGMVIYG